MKNIVQFNSKCNFTCDTPMGGDYTECPICCDFPYQWDHCYSDESTEMEYIYICRSCLILFEAGCYYKERGCTDSTYNGHFIGKWKDLTNNEIYVGMPQFDSIEEWKARVNDVEILEWICPNQGRKSDAKIQPDCELIRPSQPLS